MTAATGSAPAWAERTFQPAGHDTVAHTWTAPTRFAAAVGLFSHEPIEHSIGLSREDTLTVDGTGAPKVVEGETQVYLFGIEWVPVDQVPALIAALQEVLEAASAVTGPLCRCGKPAAHLDADPDTADWACRVPVRR